MCTYKAVARLVDENNKAVGFEFVDKSGKLFSCENERLLSRGCADTDIIVKGSKFFFRDGKRKISDLPKKLFKLSEMKHQSLRNKKSTAVSKLKPKKYLWVEDSKAGLEFWKWLCKELRLPYIVESPSQNGIAHGNGQLHLAVKNLTDTFNIYYVLMDEPYGDMNTQELHKKLCANASSKPNVHIIDKYVGFEAILVSFVELLDWLHITLSSVENDLFMTLQQHLNSYGKIALNKSAILRFKSKYTHHKYGTVERLCTAFIEEITKNIDYFQVAKSDLGNCWICDCCEHSDVSCGLKLSASDKAVSLYNKSYLRGILQQGGLVL